MSIVGKSSLGAAVLLLICTCAAGCAPDHNPPVDYSSNLVLLRDTRRADRVTQTVIAGDRYLVVMTPAGRDQPPGPPLMFEMSTVSDPALRTALQECATLRGESLGERAEYLPSDAPVRRSLCPVSTTIGAVEHTTDAVFAADAAIGPVLDRLYLAVDSPGYEIKSPPTWAFQSHVVISRCRLDAIP